MAMMINKEKKEKAENQLSGKKECNIPKEGWYGERKKNKANDEVVVGLGKVQREAGVVRVRLSGAADGNVDV